MHLKVSSFFISRKPKRCLPIFECALTGLIWYKRLIRPSKMTLRYLTPFNFSNQAFADFVLRLYNPYLAWVEAGKPNGQFADFDEVVESLKTQRNNAHFEDQRNFETHFEDQRNFEMCVITELVSSGLWESFMSGVKMSEGYKGLQALDERYMKALQFDTKYFKRPVPEAIYIYGDAYGRAIESSGGLLSKTFRAFIEQNAPLVADSDGVFDCDTDALSRSAFARGIGCFGVLFTNMLEKRDIARIVRSEIVEIARFEMECPGIQHDRQEAHNDCLKWASKSAKNMELYRAYGAVLVWIRHFGAIPGATLKTFIRKNVNTYGKLYQPLVRKMLIGLKSIGTEPVDEAFIERWCSLMQ
jgi:hypothetical protein